MKWRQFTITRYPGFRRLLKRDGGSRFERGIARVAVLLEDLRLEVHGVALDREAVPTLEEAGENYRLLYFMRRAMGTLHEFENALRSLSQMAEFQAILSVQAQDQNYVEYWMPTIDFFRRNRLMLRAIRNDVGGHFGEKAVERAFPAIADDYPAKVEIQLASDVDGKAILGFAAEISAAALLAHLPGTSDAERSRALQEFLFEAVRHAIQSVYFLAVTVLWPRTE